MKGVLARSAMRAAILGFAQPRIDFLVELGGDLRGCAPWERGADPGIGFITGKIFAKRRRRVLKAVARLVRRERRSGRRAQSRQ